MTAPSFTVQAVSDWRVTVLEDRGDGRTSTWEIPLAWVDRPIVGEPLRGVIYPVAQPLTDGDVLLRVIQRLNATPYSLTKAECISEIQAMRAHGIGQEGSAA